jgi:predicted Zn-dependent peptidase
MEEDPRQVVQMAFAEKLFGSHPYARPVEGTLAGLEAVQRSQVADFYREFYRPNNAAVTVVGQISLEEAQTLVAKALENWKPAPVRRPTPAAPPELKKPLTVKIDRPISQANMIWGHLGIARSNPDYYALQVMNYILGGGGFVSRLMDQIRDQVVSLSNIFSYKGHEIACEINSGDVFLSVDQAIPCALVVNEILSNAFKHAFRGRDHGTINISVSLENEKIRIAVTDEGVGIPDNFDINRSNSLGLKLIRTLVQHQLKGSILINSKNGTEMVVEFPVTLEET